MLAESTPERAHLVRALLVSLPVRPSPSLSVCCARSRPLSFYLFRYVYVFDPACEAAAAWTSSSFQVPRWVVFFDFVPRFFRSHAPSSGPCSFLGQSLPSSPAASSSPVAPGQAAARSRASAGAAVLSGLPPSYRPAGEQPARQPARLAGSQRNRLEPTASAAAPVN